VKVEIVAFWGGKAPGSGESQRLAEVIQAGFGLGASMQTPCRQEEDYCYCDGWDGIGDVRRPPVLPEFSPHHAKIACRGPRVFTPPRKDRVSGTPSFDGMAVFNPVFSFTPSLRKLQAGP
jgi:hypothetical protein